MKYILLLLFITSCENKAAEYAKLVDSKAVCTELHTEWIGSDPDLAVCRVGTEIWLCEADHRPSCEKVRDIPLEANSRP